ncbi:MAG: Xaa-Pro aminopeptidase, partial [candidate division KSB1 bacterium]
MARFHQRFLLKTLIAFSLCFIRLPTASAQTTPALGSLRQQAALQQQWLQTRLERVLPQLMRRHGVAMWLVVCREYNEDPAFYSLVSPTTFAARRRTIYVFFDRGEKDGVERLALGGGAQGGVYTVYRDPEVENRELWGNGQWALLRKLIDERNPASIGVNISSTHAFSDGLSAGEWEALQKALGEKWLSRVVRAELLPLDYIATRLPEMLPTYRDMMQIVHHLIARAFSREVIKPGTTTSEDVVWWLRQQVNDL